MEKNEVGKENEVMGDVYEYVDGYDNSNAYSDDMVFEVSKEDKSISVIKKQILISGERNSQYIEFQMPRYYDGIDLSEKNIEVIYVTETGVSDINKAINVRRNEEQILFGWLVPGGALQDPGTLSFCIEFAGEEYVMKTMPVEIEVHDGMNGSDIMEEPTDQVWYMQIQNLCSQTLEKAQEHETNAATSEENAQTYMQDAQEANEQANQAKESIQGAVKQITNNRLSIEELEKENAQLKARLDTAVGNYTGSEEGEIADARIDRSGKVYGALGAAIRGQLDEQENKLKKETASLKEDLGDIDENLGKSTVYGRNAIDSSKYDGLILTDELVGELTNNPPVFEIHNAFEIGQNSVATNLFFQDGTRVEGVRGLRVNYYDENGEIISKR